MGTCWGSPVENQSPGTVKNSINESGHSSSSPGTDGQISETPKMKVYTFAELKTATENFRPDNLGEGDFVSVFKGWVDENTYAPSSIPGSGMVVAVRSFGDEWGTQGLEQRQLEVNFLMKISHPNLVKLIGYCFEDEIFLLVYEFMQKSSLETHLFQRGSTVQPLSWSTRLKIALGAARGLEFLHTLEKQIIYSSFKSSDILLDKNFNAKLFNLGLTKNVPARADSPDPRVMMHTDPYAAPENVFTDDLCVESDVYGFGVVLLEILTGLQATDLSRPRGQQNLVQWAKPLLSDRRKLMPLMDSQLSEQFTVKGAVQAAQLALKCLAYDPRNRPSMKEVVEALEQIQSIKPKGIQKLL